MLGQALDRALGDRAGIARYGSATVPMDEARASCAIDISGRPFTLFEAELPPGATGGFEHELTEEFFRALANAAKLTLHLRVEAGSNAHHMIEAAFKAFARALRQAVAIDPTETGVPEHEGHADTHEPSAIVLAIAGARRDRRARLRHGQPPLGREGARARRRARARHQRPRAAARGRRPGRARRGRVPARDGATCASWDWTSCCASASARARPCSASAWACSWRSTRSTELGGAAGLGIVPARCARWTPGRSSCRTSAGTRCSFTRTPTRRWSRDLPQRCAFYHVHSLRARSRRRAGRPRHRRVRRAVRHAPCSAAPSTACSSTPRSPPPPACACSRNFARICIAAAAAELRPPPVRLYPAIDILGGNAVRLVKGDFDAKKVYDEDPLSAARGWVRAGAEYLHVVDLDGARPAQPVNLEQLRRIAGRGAACPCSTAAACAPSAPSREALARGRRARDPRHGRVHRPDVLREVPRRARPRARPRRRGRARRPRRHARLAAEHRRAGARGVRAAARARRAQLRVHQHRPRRHARRRQPRRGRLGGARRPRAAA